MHPHKMNMGKKQFRIGDLADELKVKKFVIRFWEKEFGLKSDRSQGGQRFYTDEDLKTFAIIKELLYTKGFTIAGAKKQLYDILKGKVTLDVEASLAVPVAEVSTEKAEQSVPDEGLSQEFSAAALTEGLEEEKNIEAAMVAVSADEQAEDCTQEACEHDNDIENFEEEIVTPATKVKCNCQDVLRKLELFKETLLSFKNKLE